MSNVVKMFKICLMLMAGLELAVGYGLLKSMSAACWRN